MTYRRISGFLVLLAMAACGGAPPPAPTQVQLQALQSREFETDKTKAFGAVMTVFQDMGYVISSADKDTGFITAEGPSSDTGGFWAAAADMSIFQESKATAFVEEFADGRTKIRLNFVVSKTTTTKGRTSVVDKPIQDAELYENVFFWIDQALFVRSATE